MNRKNAKPPRVVRMVCIVETRRGQPSHTLLGCADPETVEQVSRILFERAMRPTPGETEKLTVYA